MNCFAWNSTDKQWTLPPAEAILYRQFLSTGPVRKNCFPQPRMRSNNLIEVIRRDHAQEERNKEK